MLLVRFDQGWLLVFDLFTVSEEAVSDGFPMLVPESYVTAVL